MPCDSINVVSVKLETADFGLLKKALEALGWNPVGVECDRILSFFADGFGYAMITKGQLSLRGRQVIGREAEELATQIKREYATQVVTASAQRFGWVANRQKDNPYKIQLRARGR